VGKIRENKKMDYLDEGKQFTLNSSSTTDQVSKYYSEGIGLLGTVIVTGANTGLGKETSLALAKLKCQVVLACRSVERANEAMDEIKLKCSDKPNCHLSAIQLDLSSLASVQHFVAEFRSRQQSENWPQLTTLILNAGVYPFSYQTCGDNIEHTFHTNHLGHYLLTRLLLPDLRKTAGARVIVVSSDSHYGSLLTDNMTNKAHVLDTIVHCPPSSFSSNAVYGSSKLCNVLFASHLHHLEALRSGSHVVACSLHPGSMIPTDVGRNSTVVDFLLKWILSPFTKSINQGCSTTIACSLMPSQELDGRYFCDCSPKEARPLAQDRVAQEVLWELSEELVKDYLP
jgi:WW domain-containing oxidoreductase